MQHYAFTVGPLRAQRCGHGRGIVDHEQVSGAQERRQLEESRVHVTPRRTIGNQQANRVAFDAAPLGRGDGVRKWAVTSGS
jgi:hypothetical protein